MNKFTKLNKFDFEKLSRWDQTLNYLPNRRGQKPRFLKINGCVLHLKSYNGIRVY